MEILHYRGGNKTKLGIRLCPWWWGGSPFQKKHLLLAVHTQKDTFLTPPKVKKCHVKYVISPFLISLCLVLVGFFLVPFFFPSLHFLMTSLIHEFTNSQQGGVRISSWDQREGKSFANEEFIFWNNFHGDYWEFSIEKLELFCVHICLQ